MALFLCPREIRFSQLCQQLVIRKPIGPAAAGEDGGIQFLVVQVQPGGPLVVEVRDPKSAAGACVVVRARSIVLGKRLAV
jgi:hypothetical protein